MTIQRGEVWLADMNPTVGSEQAGVRPALVFQNDTLGSLTTTVIAIPFTTNLRRAALPSSVRVKQGEGGLSSDSVLLCHQLRVMDKIRFQRKLGTISDQTLTRVEECVLLTLGIRSSSP